MAGISLFFYFWLSQRIICFFVFVFFCLISATEKKYRMVFQRMSGQLLPLSLIVQGISNIFPSLSAFLMAVKRTTLSCLRFSLLFFLWLCVFSRDSKFSRPLALLCELHLKALGHTTLRQGTCLQSCCFCSHHLQISITLLFGFVLG